MESTMLAELLRKRRIRMKLKAFVRLLMANRIWLSDVEESPLTMNYKKNIAIITRRKREPGLLSSAEKALIIKPHWKRTNEERKKLALLLSSLICFRSFSPRARSRLVPHIKYLYYNAGRVILKQGYKSEGIYFIIDGEVIVTKKVWDCASREFVEKEIAVLASGDMFGGYSLMHGMQRAASITSMSDLELLFMYEDGFKATLKEELRVMYYHKKKAVQLFKQCDHWNILQKHIAWNISTIENYQPLETIYSEDKGILDPVHFILSGTCYILHCLRLKVTYVEGKKIYTLCKEENEKKDEEQKDNISLRLRYEKDKEDRKKQKEMHIAKEKEMLEEIDEDELEEKLLQKSEYDADYKQQFHILREAATSRLSKSGAKIDWTKVNYCGVKINLGDDIRVGSSESMSKESGSLVEPSILQYMNDENFSVTNLITKSSSSKHSSTFVSKHNLEKSSQHEVVKDTGSKIQKKSILKKVEENLSGVSVRFVEDNLKTATEDSDMPLIEEHLMVVGTMGPGSVFGLGERMLHRAIVSKSNVQCLLIPRFWLLEKAQNPGNVWQSIKAHLDTYVPSPEKLFNNFLQANKWVKYQNEFLRSEQKEITCSTFIENIPISIRLWH